jgi:hypothetical protein
VTIATLSSKDMFITSYLDASRWQGLLGVNVDR